MKNENIQGSTNRNGIAVVGGQKDATSYFIAAPDEAIARKLEDSVKAAL